MQIRDAVARGWAFWQILPPLPACARSGSLRGGARMMEKRK
jgi:hypothetical protein